MKKIFCLLSFMLMVAMPLYAQEVSAPKKELILKFIDVFGTKRTMAQNLQAMFEDMGPNDPQTKTFKENVSVDEIIEKLIPLYDKYFTEDELKACITFYSSPDGQKLLTTIPLLMRDSVDISAKYFEEKFPTPAAEENVETSEEDAVTADEDAETSPSEDNEAISDKNTTP